MGLGNLFGAAAISSAVRPPAGFEVVPFNTLEEQEAYELQQAELLKNYFGSDISGYKKVFEETGLLTLDYTPEKTAAEHRADNAIRAQAMAEQAAAIDLLEAGTPEYDQQIQYLVSSGITVELIQMRNAARNLPVATSVTVEQQAQPNAFPE